jgi:uncharacterized membrane protein YkoI
MRKLLVERVCVLSLAMTLMVSAQERKIKKADLPPAVAKTVASQSQGATVRSFSEETENGKTYYEVELRVNGHSKDILMDTDGGVVEVEEDVAIDSLPTSVQVRLQTLSGKGQILKVESLTKRGNLVAYEAQVLTDGRKSEIKVNADGTPLDHED